MLSKNKIKDLSRYQQKKHRDTDNVFIAEGNKLVSELLQSFTCICLVANLEWLQQNNPKAAEILEASEIEIKKISLLTSPQGVFGVFEKPNHEFSTAEISNKLSLALDDIQDPGNLGTILRIADWFGIENIFCSKHCADIYNPKTIQASMGAIARVKVFNVDLIEFLSQQKGQLDIYGTLLDGENIYQKNINKNGIIVMGNEGNGISPEVQEIISERLYIPNFPSDRETSESLNVAVATAIICAEFRRKLQ